MRESSSRSTRERSTDCCRIRSRRPGSPLRCRPWLSCASLPPFAGLGSTLLAELLEHGVWKTFPPGVALVSEGEQSDRFYVLGSGKAAVSQGGQPIRTLEPGSYFGEIGLLRSTPRSATVTSTTPVRAFALDRAGFEQVVAESFRRGHLKLSVGRMGHH